MQVPLSFSKQLSEFVQKQQPPVGTFKRQIPRPPPSLSSIHPTSSQLSHLFFSIILSSSTIPIGFSRIILFLPRWPWGVLCFLIRLFFLVVKRILGLPFSSTYPTPFPDPSLVARDPTFCLSPTPGSLVASSIIDKTSSSLLSFTE